MRPPTGWADAATKHDLDQLEARMDLRFESFEARLDARLAEGQRRMMQWTVATVIAMTGVTTAISTAIARLS
jgi:hypothetical protein